LIGTLSKSDLTSLPSTRHPDSIDAWSNP